MKKIYYFTPIFLLIFCFISNAQNVGINEDGSAPAASAILDVKSLNKGILIPRLTKAQRNSIVNPLTGLLIFQTTDTTGFYYFEGTWKRIGNQASDTELQFAESPAASISLENINQWNAAYAWGDHSGLYRPIDWVPDWASVQNNPFLVHAPAHNQILRYNSVSGKWENVAPSFLSSQISDLDLAISFNESVQANTAKFSYPAEDAAKLASIESGAEANVNPDWNATTGDAMILNKPALATVATSGDYADLDNKPALAAVATTGSYTDLTNKPVISDFAISGDYNDLDNKPVLALVATSGNYTDLLNKPVLADVAYSGDYGDLDNKPFLHDVAISGDYGDLDNKPFLHIVASTGDYGDLDNIPVFATVATSGSYNDLTNKPTGNAFGDMLYWNGSSWLPVPAGQPGQLLQFTTAGKPEWTGAVFATITTNPAIIITSTGASCGGNITSDGGAAITARGVCWYTSPNPTVANTKTTDATGTGAFTSAITGLAGNTTYYVRAYATSSIGTSYGSQVSFTTLPPVIPTLTTTAISNLTSSTASSGGVTSSDGGALITSRGVCWSTSANPTIADTKTIDSYGSGTFTSAITGLSSNVLYHARAYATNSAGTAYGNDVNFTTLSAVPPTVTTTAITAIKSTTATGGGNVTASGGSAITARGVCYSTSVNPTIADTRIVSTAGTGAFTSAFTGLILGTTYHVRAYATNSYGTSYGADIVFTAALSVGENWAGGKIAYIFQPADPGYVAGETHGIIAAIADQSTGTSWGCYGSILGADGTAIGTGEANTQAIVDNCSTAGIAARICTDLNQSGYSDWYLPSIDELQELFNNRTAIGGFSTTSYYLSSTEYNSNYPWFIYFSNGAAMHAPSTKSINTFRVRAVRTF